QVSPQQATGVSLASVVFISTVGTVTELLVHASNVRWLSALWLTGSSLMGSWLGGRLLGRLDERPLRVGLAAMLILSTWRLLTMTGAESRALESATAPDRSLALVVAGGLLAGAACVLFGVGGGVMVVPALLLLAPEVPFPAVTATSLAAIVPTAAFSAYQHLRRGTVDGSLVRRLSTFGVVGAILGTI